MHVSVHLLHQSQPTEIVNVRNTYTKGPLYCVMTNAGSVYKFPIEHIFRITENDG